MGLKQKLKQVLINQQHRRYETTLSQKKMTYQDWIEKKEEEIKKDNLIGLNCLKSQKIEISCDENASCTDENERNSCKNGADVYRYELLGAEKDEKPEFTFLEVEKAFLQSKNPVETANKLKKLLLEEKTDVILFKAADAELSPLALLLIRKTFLQDDGVVVAYGDEDVRNGDLREKPWFKPDWSPDTFLSHFYFGSLVAIRRKAVLEALDETAALVEMEDFLYELCKCVICKAGGFAKHEELWRQKPVCHIPEVLVHTGKEGYEAVKHYRLCEPEVRESDAENGREIGAENRLESNRENGKKPLISVVIPSKDNPDVLFTCIHSFLQKTKTSYPYEILVVDNGSNEENKSKISAEAERLNKTGKNDIFKGMIYHHEPMVFNFSRMCNLGVSLSHGELLLFLNDDMEVIQENWLTLLANKAMLSYVGAVGAKLLYPDSDIIQHAGITNLRVGPAHKLQFLSDDTEHYYGKNKGVHNMLGATGACLMMRKNVFESVHGFAEDLAVAFNDVDLCYKIYEAGYYNVTRNDVVLYHHESLSRGKDGESEEKQQRLLREKDVLYERHQEIYGKDPFYHKYLTNDMLESEYAPAVRYQVTLDMPWAEVRKEEKLAQNIREDACVVIGMEAAMDIYKWKYGVAPGKGKQEPLAEEMGYYFQGYSFVIGSDNACYKKTLLLENKENGQVIRIPLDIRYRPDIRKNLKDQLNVDLTGYAAKVRLSDIPKGLYRFGMLAEDGCSRLKLVNWSSWTLQV